MREEVKEEAYTLVLEFETKKDMTMDMWTDRLDKIETFFGPGINAKVNQCRPCSSSLHPASGQSCDCMPFMRACQCILPRIQQQQHASKSFSLCVSGHKLDKVIRRRSQMSAT